MPEDRFGDLGRPDQTDEPGREPAGPAPVKQGAGERFAELDRVEPEQQPRAPHGPVRPTARYTWVVGVVAVIVIVIVGINSLPHSGLGTHGPPIGHPLLRFAAPNALGTLDGDPNIKQSARDNSQSNHTPACAVRGPSVVNLCELEQKPLVLTFIVPGAKDCEAYLDRVQRLTGQYPQVNFAAVVSGRPKATVAALVRRHGWTFPVAVDRHLEVFTLYHVAFCATSTFAYRGGIVRADKILAQNWPDASLQAAIRATIGKS